MIKIKFGQAIMISAIVFIAVVSAIFALDYLGYTESDDDERISISYFMHESIDPLYPDFIQTARVSCTAADGTWIEQSDKMGCFDIPAGEFDTRQCLSTGYSQIQQFCTGIGGTWMCNENGVGCFYE